LNESKKYGLLAGLATVGYFLLFYVIDRSLFLDWKVYWSSLLIYVFCMYRACVATRSKNENEVLSFPDGFRISFQTFIIANGIFYLFYYILFNFVDPGLVDLQKELAQQLYLDVMGEEKAKPMIEAMNKEGFEMNLRTILWEFVKGAIAGAALSLVVAGAVRQE
jgi:magnesium-transporting ATPase (P-type)